MERDVELQAEIKPFLLQLLLVCLITAIDPANTLGVLLEKLPRVLGRSGSLCHLCFPSRLSVNILC